MRLWVSLLILVLLVSVHLSCDWFKKEEGKEQQTEQLSNTALPTLVDPSQFSGPRFLYYENGQVKAERNFKDGQLHGPYISYYDNGQIKVDGYYLNNMMNGRFKRYNRDGTLKSEEIYKDNFLTQRQTFGLTEN
jgi:antitoxin component YwqK of YwqJK toxin-antitoxin module